MRSIAATRINDKAPHFATCTLLRRGVSLALIIVLPGMALDFAQRLVPARGFEVAGTIANALGVSAGIVVFLVGQA